jgi:hypothetical protein
MSTTSKSFKNSKKLLHFTSACPESLNPTYGSPRPLGVKTVSSIHGYHHGLF